MKVFIADESSTLSARLVTIISEIDKVTIAGIGHDPARAIQSIQATKPDIVIIGFHTPHRSALEVLQLLKQEYPKPVVIVLTNHVYKLYVDRCMEAGADYVFDKGTDLEKVTQCLAGLVHENIRQATTTNEE